MPEEFNAAQVVEVWDESPTLRAIRLDLGALTAQHTRPGQVLKVKTAKGDGFYALASRVGDGGEILVRRGDGSTMGDALVESAKPHATLEVTAPFGKGFPIESAREHDVILFAAGSGIAPMRSLLYALAKERAAYGQLSLYYGERVHSFAYGKEHAGWREAGFDVHLCASRADGTDWKGAHGYVQDIFKKEGLGRLKPERTVAFLCGMKAMVAAARDALAAVGVPAERTFLNF